MTAFQEKATGAKDQDIKAFAAALLPTLQEHRKHLMMMTGARADDAQSAGSRQRAEDRTGSDSASHGTSSSGTGARENGSGTVTVAVRAVSDRYQLELSNGDGRPRSSCSKALNSSGTTTLIPSTSAPRRTALYRMLYGFRTARRCRRGSRTIA